MQQLFQHVGLVDWLKERRGTRALSLQYWIKKQALNLWMAGGYPDDFFPDWLDEIPWFSTPEIYARKMQPSFKVPRQPKNINWKGKLGVPYTMGEKAPFAGFHQVRIY